MQIMTAEPISDDETVEEAGPAKLPDRWIYLAWITSGASPLRAWRHAADMTPRDLSEASGISAAEITRMENRQIHLTGQQRCLLARVLGINESDLLE